MLRGRVRAALVVGLTAGCGGNGGGATSTATPASPAVTRADFAKGQDYWYGLDGDQREQAERLCKVVAGDVAAALDEKVVGRAIDAEFDAHPRSTLRDACLEGTKHGLPKMTFFVAVQSGSRKTDPQHRSARYFETADRTVTIVGIVSAGDAVIELYARRTSPSPHYVKIRRLEYPDIERGFKFVVALRPGENRFELRGGHSHEAKPNRVRLVIAKR